MYMYMYLSKCIISFTFDTGRSVYIIVHVIDSNYYPVIVDLNIYNYFRKTHYDIMVSTEDMPIEKLFYLALQYTSIYMNKVHIHIILANNNGDPLVHVS